MHTPERGSSPNIETKKPIPKNVIQMEAIPFLKVNSGIEFDLKSINSELVKIENENPMKLGFQGGNMADAAVFYEEQQKKKDQAMAKLNARIAELTAEQSLMRECGSMGLEDPREWMGSEEERLAQMQAGFFKSKQQLEVMHAHTRGPEQVITSKKLEELAAEMKANASRMGAIVRVRNRWNQTEKR